jgi:hypothetical protein
MKNALMLLATFAAVVGAVCYDGLAAEHGCRVTYETSFNGLYLIKERACTGALGLPHNPREIDRRALFTAF